MKRNPVRASGGARSAAGRPRRRVLGPARIEVRLDRRSNAKAPRRRISAVTFLGSKVPGVIEVLAVDGNFSR